MTKAKGEIKCMFPDNRVEESEVGTQLRLYHAGCESRRESITLNVGIIEENAIDIVNIADLKRRAVEKERSLRHTGLCFPGY